MTHHAEFRCFDRCGERYPLDEVVFKCRKCGGLLDVHHDMEALAGRTGEEWKALFDERKGTGEWPLSSGVWSKREWVLPQIEENDIVSLGEGSGPLVPSPRLAHKLGLSSLWIKGCGISHSGSFKDLGMTVLVSAVQRMRNQGQAIAAIGCASTGDTSAALASYCAAANIPSVVLLPRGKISRAQLVQPLSNQAKVLSLDTDFDGCMKIMAELSSQGVLYLANSMNPLRLEGQKTAAINIAQALRWKVPDFVVLPGGNLGNVYAFGRGFQMMHQLGLVDRVPRMVVAQAAMANPLYRAFRTGFTDPAPMVAGETEATAIRIGDPVSLHRAIRILQETDGLVMDATEEELAKAVALGDQCGFYLDPHTGVALAALKKLVEANVVGKGAEVVVINTAHGLKFTEHKVKFHGGELTENDESGLQNSPIEIPADAEAVLDCILH
jgi:threonine synthase